MHLVSFALSVQMYCRCVFWVHFLKKGQKKTGQSPERGRGGRVHQGRSETAMICTKPSHVRLKGWDRQHTPSSLPLSHTHTLTHSQTQACRHWCVAVVAAPAHVSMLWLQSLASFAEDHGRGKVTAFLDRAASLCPFRAAPPVCRACWDTGSLRLKVLQNIQTEQVFQCFW